MIARCPDWVQKEELAYWAQIILMDRLQSFVLVSSEIDRSWVLLTASTAASGVWRRA